MSNTTLKNWIWPVTPENWPNVKGKQIWAVGKVGKGKYVEKGDRIIFYVNGSSCFQGIYEVASDWHGPTEQWSGDVGGETEPVLEIDLKLIEVGYANVKKLTNQLEFIANKNFGINLRGTPAGPANSGKPVSNNDYELILEELKQVQTKPYKIKSQDFVDMEEFKNVTSWDFMKERVHELSTPDLKSVNDIIENIKNGKYAIPIFQREYVWKPKQIEELWESIFQGFFVGSILTWNSNESLKKMPIHGAPELSDSHDIVLDGQQRMASLFYAVTAPKDPLPNNHSMLFFVDLKVLLDPNANPSDIVFSEIVDDVPLQNYSNKEKEFNRKIFPLTKFNKRDYALWLGEFTTYLKEVEKWDNEKVTSYYKQILNILDQVWFQYKIPIIRLPKSVSLDGVAEVFEKINSKGTSLGVFDLLNARFSKYDIKLRELWSDTKSNYNNISEMSDSIENVEKYVLQGMSLYKKRYIRRKELLTLDSSYKELGDFQKQKFKNDWLKISHFISKAIGILKSQRESGFGAVKFSIIPYTIIIPILSALMLEIEDRADKPNCMNKIQNWYWSVVTSDSYSGSTDSKIEKDYREILQWFDDDNDIPEIILKQRQEIDSLDITSAKPNDSVYKTIMCLISKCEANDFVTDEPPEYSTLDDHHIFPKSRKNEYKSDISVNSILNRTMLNSDTNRNYIKDKKPSIYLKEIIDEQAIDELKLRKRLQSHLISDDAFGCLMQNNFDGFVKAREKTIHEKLRELIMPIEPVKQNSVHDLLHNNESQILEYKSSMRWDIKRECINPELGEEVVRGLCAFMNSNDGNLLIGVNDEGNPIGLKKDYSTFSGKGFDGFSLHLTNLINKHLGKNTNRLITLDSDSVEGHELCWCKIKFSTHGPIYCMKNNKPEFYIRTNNSTQPLNMKEAHEYISKKWGIK